MNKNHAYDEFVWQLVETIPSAPETLVLFALGYLMTKTGAKISRRYLSIKTGLSVRTVTRSLASLKDQGVISIKKSSRDDGSTSINTYNFCGYTPSQSVHGGVTEWLGKDNYINTNKNNTSLKHKGKSKYNSSFLDVYNLYPKLPIGRTNKSTSAQKFHAIKDLDPTLIFDAVTNRLTAFYLNQSDPDDFQYLEGLQVLLNKDLTQFLTNTQHPDGEFVLPKDNTAKKMFIKDTNLVNTTALLANTNIRSIAQISKENNDKQLK